MSNRVIVIDGNARSYTARVLRNLARNGERTTAQICTSVNAKTEAQQHAVRNTQQGLKRLKVIYRTPSGGWNVAPDTHVTFVG
jgi:hypothetical protein